MKKVDRAVIKCFCVLTYRSSSARNIKIIYGLHSGHHIFLVAFKCSIEPCTCAVSINIAWRKSFVSSNLEYNWIKLLWFHFRIDELLVKVQSEYIKIVIPFCTESFCDKIQCLKILPFTSNKVNIISTNLSFIIVSRNHNHFLLTQIRVPFSSSIFFNNFHHLHFALHSG